VGIGERIWGWLTALPYFDGVRDRSNEMKALVTPFLQSKEAGWRLDMSIWVFLVSTLYIVFNVRLPLPDLMTLTPDPVISDLSQFNDDPRGYVRKKLHEFGTSAEAKAFAEFVGTIITEPVVSLLETYSADENVDPHEMARAFHGIASGLPWAAETIDNGLRLVLGDRAPSVGKNIMALYWGLGLGFLGWQTLAPLLSAGLQPNLTRYYNKLYRPSRFTPGQARDIFALGIWSADQMANYLREDGWRDGDIQTWINLSYRDLSEGVLWDLYERGLVSQPEVSKRLRKLGYNPDDLPLLFKAHEKTDTTDAQKYLVSTAKAALKKGLMGQSEFREILTGLNYASREIDLQISLVLTQQETDLRELTTGQIRELYENRVIGSTEVVANLIQIKYESDVANQLLQAWNNEALPKAARLNKSTITEAYQAGVLARNDAMALLIKEAGYADVNAELILKIEDAQAAARGAIEAIEGPAVSLSILTDFAQNGLITKPAMLGRAELARFTSEDRDRIVTLMFATPVEQPVELGPDALLDAFRRGVITQEVLRERLITMGLSAGDTNILIASLKENLSPSLIADAYVAGVIDRPEIEARLRGYGLSDEDGQIFIETVELENPDVFGDFRGRFIKRASVGSLQLAFQRGMITEAQFTDRLTSQGYSTDAIAVYIFNAEFQEPARPKALSKADILSLYQNGQFSRTQALARLQQIGYNIEDATLLVDQREVTIQDTEIGQAYIAGYIDQFGAAAALTDQGWSDEEIINFFLAVETGSI